MRAPQTPVSSFSNRWAFCGTVILFAGALGHLILVDFAVLRFEVSFAVWMPESLLRAMRASQLQMGMFGGNNVFRIFSGFSFWVGASLFLLATYNTILLRHLPRGDVLRRKILYLSLIVALAFSCTAVFCFIYAAAVGGALASLCFALSIRSERSTL